MKRFVLLTMLIPLFFISCEKAEDPVLTVSGESISAPAKGSSTTFQLFSNNPWTVSAPGWCTVSPSGGDGASGEVQVKVTVKENDTYDNRTADITFVSGELTKTVKVSQTAKKGVVLPKDEYKVSSEAQQLEVTVKANVEYKVEIDVDWIRQAGTKALETTIFLFDIEPNEGYDPRQAVINIIDEEINDTLSIEIEQVQQDAIFVSPTEYNLSCKEHTLELEVQTNVDLEVAIPESAKGWVSHIETKALEDKTIVLKVAANTEYDPRTCEIQIKKKGEDYSETIFIYQEELQGVVLSEKVFNVSSEKQNVEVKFQTNASVEYEVSQECKEWISVVETKALEDKVLVLAIKENTGFDERSGNVLIRMEQSNYADTVKIIQQHKDTLYASEKLFNVVKEGAAIEVKVFSTVEYDTEILSDWITSTATKALTEKTHVFDIAANSDVQGRNGYIVFKSKTTDHKDTVVVNQNGSGGYIWYNGIVASKSVPGSGTEGDPYIIHTANDLQWLIDQAEYGTEEILIQNNYDILKTNRTVGKYYKLTHDLTIDSDYDIVDGSGNVIQAKGWTPIASGYGDNNHISKLQTFMGHFDGSGHTIDGKMVPVHNSLSKSGIQYFGLFGYCEYYYDSQSGVEFYAGIKNLNMNVTVECDRYVSHQGDYAIMVGALLGYGEGAHLQIENCTVRGTVTAGMSFEDKLISCAVGGIAGYFKGSKIINSHNYSTVTGGYATGSVMHMCVGGLVGDAYFSKVNFDNCTNYGKVTSGNVINSLYIGGIGGEITNFLMNNCHNYGDIAAGAVTYDKPADRYSSVPNIYIGGIIGTASGENMINCSNTGTITSGLMAVNAEPYQQTNSTLYIGGVGGFLFSSANNCTNKGNLIVKSSEEAFIGGFAGNFCGAEAISCTNHGKITFNGDILDCCLGGFSGTSRANKIIECVNYSDVTGPENVKYGHTGGLSGISADALILRSVNKGNVIGSQSSIDNGIIYVGGLTGDSQIADIIENCINEGDVTAVDSKGTVYIGGLTAISSNDFRLYASTNKGDVKCGGAMSSATGGIIGYLGYLNSSSVVEGCINEGTVIGGTCTYDYNAAKMPFDMTSCTGGIAGVIRSNGVIKGASTNKGNIIPGTHKFGKTTYDGSLVGYSVHNTTTICTCTKDESGSLLNSIGGGYINIKEDTSCTEH